MVCLKRSLSILLAASALALPGAASAAWTKAYVIEAFEPAFYFGADQGDSAPGTDCPNGAIPEMDWTKMLKTTWRTDAEVKRIMDPEDQQRVANGAFRGPSPDINVYAQPWTVPDTGIAEVQGGLAYGFDLDSNSGTGGFATPDGKTHGIDNAYYKTTGCLMAWRGLPRQGHHVKYVIDGMRDGQFTMLMLVSGVGADPANDPDVKVAFYQSRDKLVKDANGEIAPDFTFRVSAAPGSLQSLVEAKTTGGVLTTRSPSTITTRNIDRLPLTFQKAQMRFEIKPDGSLEGMIGGYRSIDDYYADWQTGGTIFELTMHLNTPLVWYALHRNADGIPDAAGHNTAISTAYRYYAKPAFVITPDAKSQVTVAQIFPAESPVPGPRREAAEKPLASNAPANTAASEAHVIRQPGV